MSTSSTSVRVLLSIGLFCACAAPAAAEFSAADVYRAASPSVVVIFGLDSSGAGSSGTGSIITADGKILTNNHVIVDAKRKAPYDQIVVFFKPARVTGNPEVDLKTQYKVRILGRDERMDLALLQVIDPPPNLRPLRMSDSESVEIGSSVAAIGHPGGGGLWTLTTGTISSARRDGSRDVFQTDAAINPGNSGGPLLDENAQLIGVNTFVRRVNDAGLPLEGLNYSLRSHMAHDWLARQRVQVAFATPASPAVVDHAAQAQQPAPEPSAEPAPAPAPRYDSPAGFETDAEPLTPSQHAQRPRPQVAIDPETGPQTRLEPLPPSTSRDEPRAFVGPDGEKMYGVPAPAFSLDEARNEVYRNTVRNADKAFDELDEDW